MNSDLLIILITLTLPGFFIAILYIMFPEKIGRKNTNQIWRSGFVFVGVASILAGMVFSNIITLAMASYLSDITKHEPNFSEEHDRIYHPTYGEPAWFKGNLRRSDIRFVVFCERFIPGINCLNYLDQDERFVLETYQKLYYYTPRSQVQRVLEFVEIFLVVVSNFFVYWLVSRKTRRKRILQQEGT